MLKRAGRVPYCWQRSEAVVLGATKLRFIHMFDPLGSMWFRLLYLTGGRYEPHYSDHGFVPHRRREAPILIQQCLQWRLRRIGRSSFKMLADMRNAFGCTTRARQEQVVEDRLGSHFFHQRQEEAVVTMTVADGTVDMKPTAGGRMGDKNEPDLFMSSFAEPIREWNTEVSLHVLERSAWRSTLARCPLSGAKVDLSLTK